VGQSDAASRTVPWPYSGRGEKRPHTAYSARTNSPLEPPDYLRRRDQAAQRRRWVDLCRFYGNKIGAARLKDEGVRALLLSLISITLQIERLRDAPLAEQAAYSELHLGQEQRALLASLGLIEAPPSNSNSGGDGHDLQNYLATKGGAP
jgi:hypothetical protein